jgi:restriction system protein
VKSASEFALDTHLEEFMDATWEGIGFGAKLVRYRSENQTGRQFPAGTWSIDFLCVEDSTGDFVIVELKKGKTSDVAVGQVLRYMGWVKQNLAKEKQKVKGIIIARR